MTALTSLRYPALKTFSLARSGLYFAESLPLTFLASVLVGRGRDEFADAEKLRCLWRSIEQLHAEDIRNIEIGLYPPSVLSPSSPAQHLLSLVKLWKDAAEVAWRMRQRKFRQFRTDAQELLGDLPEYYRRNFHFQTDGYLSETSAKLYDHQVNVLFSGAADAMRRLVIPPLRSHLKMLERSHLLELGCGPGSATIALAQAFPKTKITALDLSPPYVKTAQRRLKKYPRVDCLQGDAAHLPFRDSTFDAVTSVFMFHELPQEVRLEILREAARVLKPGGVLVMADSIQWNDDVNFNWALEKFPTNYHEPFYRNYVHTPMIDLFREVGFSTVNQHHRFLTKVVWAPKSSNFNRSKV
jgi:ubiquinone/menaquinone biosynthesis C-methylase UbiE